MIKHSGGIQECRSVFVIACSAMSLDSNRYKKCRFAPASRLPSLGSKLKNDPFCDCVS